MRLLRRLTPGLVFAFAAACTASNAPTPTPEAVVSPSPTASPSTSAAPAIPDDLVGEWTTEIGVETWNLTLRASGSYLVDIQRGAVSHDGAISVDGNKLNFFGGDPCSERGSYDWSTEGGTLTFSVIGQDECPGRATVLDGLIYTRSD
jgi:hypothetical protein